MAEFWKDYGKLCKESGDFYKKHWKGVIVLSAAIIAGEMAYIKRNQIKSKLKEKIRKEKENES